MNTYNYNRISHSSQNLARQHVKGAINYSDVCSGTIPFAQRVQASKLLEVIKYGDTVIVEDISRLGRSKTDMMSTLEHFKELGVNVRIKNLGIESFPTEGNYSGVFDIISSLLCALSEYEREQIKERTKQGIEIAKLQGNKYLGRKKGTVIPRDKYLDNNKKSVQVIRKHPNLSYRELGKLCGVSTTKVKKIKELL